MHTYGTTTKTYTHAVAMHRKTAKNNASIRHSRQDKEMGTKTSKSKKKGSLRTNGTATLKIYTILSGIFKGRFGTNTNTKTVLHLKDRVVRCTAPLSHLPPDRSHGNKHTKRRTLRQSTLGPKRFLGGGAS